MHADGGQQTANRRENWTTSADNGLEVENGAVDEIVQVIDEFADQLSNKKKTVLILSKSSLK
jgi:hypothetical protein